MTNKPMLSVERDLLEGLLRECAIEFSTAEASQFELEMLAKIRSALGAKASNQECSMADGWQFMPMTGRYKEQWLGCKNWSEMDEMKRRGLPVRNLYAEQSAPIAEHHQCEECKGWGYHENHHEGGGTECGECAGSGKAPAAVIKP